MTGTPVQFDFDAMLMLGWVTDADGCLTSLSRSVQEWIETNRMALPTAWSMLQRYRGGDIVTFEEFLGAVLHPILERETPSMILRALAALKARALALADGSATVVPNDPDEDSDYKIRYLYRPTRGGTPLLGARFIRPGGTMLALGRNLDRCDLVIVCSFSQSAEGLWLLRGFQGQLQEAWLRIEDTLLRGMQAAGIALMARNLSHNIGSHALFWLAQETSDPALKSFYKYLQVRMELLAGFATRMPLSPSSYILKNLIDAFSDNAVLLGRLCRSEGVESIEIRYEEPHGFAVAIPGGEVGVHALYALIENCIRDSSKYARRADPLRLIFYVKAEDFGDTVRLSIYDEARNFPEHGVQMTERLENLQLVDDSGGLSIGDWGVKERYICAALLRGIRPEAVPIESSGRANAAQLAQFEPDGGDRMLRIESQGDHIAWVFHLKKPGAQVLLIWSQYACDLQGSLDISAEELNVLLGEIDRPAAITATYVVAFELTQSELDRLSAVSSKLPRRCFVTSAATKPPRGFVSMDATNGFEAEVLQQRWTEAFLRRKGVNRPPAILIADLPEFVDSVLSEAAQRGRALARWDGDTDAWVWMQEPEVIIINEAGLHAKLAERKRRGAPAVILYNRHSANDGLGRFVLDPELVCYYEVFSEGQRAGFAVGVSAMEGLSDADRRLRAYALFEAALSRILIVDERLDESVSDLRRTQLEATGVIIRGAHYSTRYGPADGTALFKWLAAESWDDLIIHRGVLEKIASRTQCDVADVLDTLNDTVRVVVHSGRMDVSNLPLETKFLSLSNLSAWIDGGYSKLEIVNELAALRRV